MSLGLWQLRCLVLVVGPLFVLPALGADGLKVKTDKGVVEGALTADGKVRAFKGIPFATPPVGKLRWTAPVEAEKWKGTRDAKEFGSHCVQIATYADMVFHDPGPSEDCLSLNVWAPVKAKKLPVMVWIYGGGYAAGGTSEARQDGQFLAHRDVVVVSMNYRLGIFGFMVHPDLTAESPHHASGNYGLLDQAAALTWVRRNIDRFGGDPSNITLFGESAGSFSVSAQMASPLSKGYLAKAIGESGSALTGARPGWDSREHREARDVAFAEKTYGTSKLAELRALSVADLLKGVDGKLKPPPPNFGPAVDGYFVSETPEAIYEAGKQAHIPLLAGWNSDEGRGAVINAKVKPTVESFTADETKEFGADAPKFLAVYKATTDAEAETSAGDFAGDKFIAYGTWKWLEKHAETGGSSTYRYYFSLGSPGDKNHAAKLGAFHSDDIEYVFGTLDSRPEITVRAEDRKLSEQVGAYWTNFAKTGDPNGAGLPVWPKYGGTGGWMVMNLNAAPEAKADANRDRDLFLSGVWPKAVAP